MYILKTLYFYEVSYKTRLYSVVKLQSLDMTGFFSTTELGCNRLYSVVIWGVGALPKFVALFFNFSAYRFYLLACKVMVNDRHFTVAFDNVIADFYAAGSAFIIIELCNGFFGMNSGVTILKIVCHDFSSLFVRETDKLLFAAAITASHYNFVPSGAQ